MPRQTSGILRCVCNTPENSVSSEFRLLDTYIVKVSGVFEQSTLLLLKKVEQGSTNSFLGPPGHQLYGARVIRASRS
jgi:hypothetical protein